MEPVSYNADDRVELSEIFNGNEAFIKKYAEKLSISFERVEYAKNNFIRVVKVMKAFILIRLNPSCVLIINCRRRIRGFLILNY